MHVKTLPRAHEREGNFTLDDGVYHDNNHSPYSLFLSIAIFDIRIWDYYALMHLNFTHIIDKLYKHLLQRAAVAHLVQNQTFHFLLCLPPF